MEGVDHFPNPQFPFGLGLGASVYPLTAPKRERRSVRIAYQPEIIYLVLGGFHGPQIPAVEICPHRAAEEIDSANS